MNGVRVHVDRRKCEGTAFCVGVTDEVFALDAEGLAVVRLQAGDPQLRELRELAVEAERMCPTGAIAVRDDDA